MRVLKSSIVLLFVLFFLPVVSHAAAFPADYVVTYMVQDTGETLVEEKITITNETDDQYPAQYTLAMENISIENISAEDSGGTMRVELEPRGEFTLLTAYFNVLSHGRGSKIPWTLRYSTNKIAEKVGNLWEVTVPHIERDDRIASYEIRMSIPNSFGVVDFADPYPTSIVSQETHTEYVFTYGIEKDIVGVTASFGPYQLYDLSLKYHLYNPKTFSAVTEIALPPTQSPYQKVFVQTLDPVPYGIRSDDDGNVFAQYKLLAGQTVDIAFIGQVLVTQKMLTERTGEYLINNVSEYLKQDEYWDTTSTDIQRIAQEISTTVSGDYESIARRGYEYVAQTLTYDESRLEDVSLLERKGAAVAILEPNSAICTDYTDVTIALMRNLGIPAREINGYALTGDQELPTINDVLHAWVQVFLPQYGWVSIDPTWGSTSGQNYFDRFDTKHVIFSIRGTDSQYPYPAGSYKLPGAESDDVEVVIADDFRDGTLLSTWVTDWERTYASIDILDWLFRKIVGIH